MFGTKGRSRKMDEKYYGALAMIRQFVRKIDGMTRDLNAYISEYRKNSVEAEKKGLSERAQKFVKNMVGLQKRVNVFLELKYQMTDMEIQLKSGQTMAKFADVGISFSKALQDKRLKQIFDPNFQNELARVMDEQSENVDKLSQMIQAFDSVVSSGVGITDEEIDEQYADIKKEAGVTESSPMEKSSQNEHASRTPSKSEELDREIEENLKKLSERK